MSVSTLSRPFSTGILPYSSFSVSFYFALQIQKLKLCTVSDSLLQNIAKIVTLHTVHTFIIARMPTYVGKKLILHLIVLQFILKLQYVTSRGIGSHSTENVLVSSAN